MIRKLFFLIANLLPLFQFTCWKPFWAGLLLSLALMGGYVYYAYQDGEISLRPAAPRPVPRTLETAINEVCQDIPTQLPNPDRVLRPTLLLPLTGDREGLFTAQLRSALDRQGWYRPVEASLSDKAFDVFRDFTGIGTDPSARSMQWTSAELAKMMRSAKAETVLRGSVDRLVLPAKGPVEIKLHLELWELSPSQPDTAILTCSLDIERPMPSPSGVPGVSFWSRLRPYTIAFLIALVYPFAMIPWMRKAIREDSNSAILKALLGITAIPLLAFLLFLFWQGKSSLDIALQGGIAALFLFFYTAFVLNAVQNRIK